ncbi:unnamed protein product [Caenorhabditis sp. 36 PRJEB53466]|nr:unnamed protein product [Caenorhabditis sp. 36 PRJEB53466]
MRRTRSKMLLRAMTICERAKKPRGGAKVELVVARPSAAERAKIKRREAAKMLKHMGSMCYIANEFFTQFRIECHESGIDLTDAEKVLSFTDNKRMQFVRALNYADRGDQKVRMNLIQCAQFLRRLIERIDDFMKILAKGPPQRR